MQKKSLTNLSLCFKRVSLCAFVQETNESLWKKIGSHGRLNMQLRGPQHRVQRGFGKVE